jgi:hypothetical protein
LVVSQNTGSVQIFRNMTDRTFQPVPTKSAFGFWMGLAISDIDNDGDHLFFTNVGQSIPLFLTSGHLRDDQRHTHEWMLWRNDGNFRSTDVTDAYRLTDEGFAWGAVFVDLNLDGQLDLFVAQNYITRTISNSQSINDSNSQVARICNLSRITRIYFNIPRLWKWTIDTSVSRP